MAQTEQQDSIQTSNLQRSLKSRHLTMIAIGGSIGTGLFVSTVAKDQFIASQMAGTIGFMPSMMLSGLIYEIDSMPFLIKILSSVIPAKYYVSSISALFLSGTVFKTIFISCLYLFLFSAAAFFLNYIFTKERIE